MTESFTVESLKQFGVGILHPHDNFFEKSNEQSGYLKTFGVVQIDEEFEEQDIVEEICCHIPGCIVTCESTTDYEQHYNSCHRFTCVECKKYLPSSHLLDLHLTETHDSFFAVQVGHTPMFKCFIEECPELFLTAELRREHCITLHKFPSDFRFDDGRKNKNTQKKKKDDTQKMEVELVQQKSKKHKEKSKNQNEASLSEKDNSMEVDGLGKQKTQKPKGVSSVASTSLGFLNSRGRGRRPLLGFTQDLRKSLPE